MQKTVWLCFIFGLMADVEAERTKTCLVKVCGVMVFVVVGRTGLSAESDFIERISYRPLTK
jgi:hypothetical protein